MLRTIDESIKTAENIARRVSEMGGRTYFVGGYVRDRLLGITNTDIDIEVHGIEPGVLESILSDTGEMLKIGASFGIYALRGYSIDIALPRTERLTGQGHRDFDVSFDPYIGTKKAAMRRDFTMNAMMEDVLTGEIVDHFGGVSDIKRGIIRHVSDETYVEDPLRVLRAAQFASRFRFSIDEKTRALSASMDLSFLSRERITAELDKALMKAETPSVFFDELRKMNQLGVWFPELEALIGVPQEPRFHPEGDAWDHTLAVLDSAANLRDKAEMKREFMYAAMCHDLGKATTTELVGDRIRSLGHETAGVIIADAMLARLTDEVKLRKYVGNMVLLHMKPNIMAGAGSGVKAFAKLYDKSVCPADLLLLSKADRLGQMRENGCEADEAFLKDRLDAYNELMSRPYVSGADLVNAGFTQCAEFGDALGFAHKLRLSGVPKDIALKQTAAELKRLLNTK